jgi:hypothetical protein
VLVWGGWKVQSLGEEEEVEMEWLEGGGGGDMAEEVGPERWKRREGEKSRERGREKGGVRGRGMGGLEDLV